MALGGKVDHYAVRAKSPNGRGRHAARRRADATVANRSAVRPRLLVVEDQEDVRRMVVTALALEGYDVDEAATAREGLRLLGRNRYRLVLSDYAMPGETGAWMFAEAERLGLMSQTAALIVTAHPDVRDQSSIAVIDKPLDLDRFLDQVRRVVASSFIDSSAPASSARPRAKQNRT